jgi:hypothetical protein
MCADQGNNGTVLNFDVAAEVLEAVPRASSSTISQVIEQQQWQPVATALEETMSLH